MTKWMLDTEGGGDEVSVTAYLREDIFMTLFWCDHGTGLYLVILFYNIYISVKGFQG